jgi:ABC-type cobalamin/Fe3+-siderophores transport system ATPase subunit
MRLPLLVQSESADRRSSVTRASAVESVGLGGDTSIVITIELRNYRAFDDAHPVIWRLHDGFVAFVGVNNAGKSSLLRFLHEMRPSLTLLQRLHEGPVQTMLSGNPHPVGIESVADIPEVLSNRNGRDMTARFTLDPPGAEDDVALEPSAIEFRWRRPDALLTVALEHEGAARSIADWNASPDALNVTGPIGDVVRLDIRRYRAALADLADAIYLGPFRNAVNVGGVGNYYDLGIGEQFIAQWDAYKTGSNRAQNRQAIAVERELQAIFGLSKLEINAAPGNKTLHIIADDEPYQLQEQGAGLAQFIVVLAFVAIRQPSFILIDEPESNLHPSLQLDFLTTLARYCRRGVVFATHSIGLARAVGQEIYSVRRLADGGREVQPLAATRDYVQFLGELSLSGYSELGFSRVLLVEGTTEVPTLQRWLRLYGIEHQIVLLPLGGSSLINDKSAAALSEIARITTDVSVMIDSERAAAGAPLETPRQAFVDVCRELGFDVHVLERRALENYLTDAAVKITKGDKYRALGEFEALKDAHPHWAKNENWRIAAEMTRSDLDDTDLGAFLTTLAAQLDAPASQA